MLHRYRLRASITTTWTNHHNSLSKCFKVTTIRETIIRKGNNYLNGRMKLSKIKLNKIILMMARSRKKIHQEITTKSNQHLNSLVMRRRRGCWSRWVRPLNIISSTINVLNWVRNNTTKWIKRTQDPKEATATMNKMRSLHSLPTMILKRSTNHALRCNWSRSIRWMSCPSCSRELRAPAISLRNQRRRFRLSEVSTYWVAAKTLTKIINHSCYWQPMMAVVDLIAIRAAVEETTKAPWEVQASNSTQGITTHLEYLRSHRER